MTDLRSKFLFFISHTLGRMWGNRERYALFAILLLAVTVFSMGGMIISSSALMYSQDKETELSLSTSRIEDVWDREFEYRKQYSEAVEPVAGLVYMGKLISMLSGIFGSVAVFFSVMLLLNQRRYEIGILYSVGMSKRYIFLSMLTEILAFVLAVTLAGSLLSVLVLLILYQVNVLYDLSAYIVRNQGLVRIMLISACTLSVIPCLLLAVSIFRTSPVRILQENK